MYTVGNFYTKCFVTLNCSLSFWLAAYTSDHVDSFLEKSLARRGFASSPDVLSFDWCSSLNIGSSNIRLCASLVSGTTCSFFVGSHLFSCRLAPDRIT